MNFISQHSMLYSLLLVVWNTRTILVQRKAMGLRPLTTGSPTGRSGTLLENHHTREIYKKVLLKI
jgi:hypothetical protein